MSAEQVFVFLIIEIDIRLIQRKKEKQKVSLNAFAKRASNRLGDYTPIN